METIKKLEDMNRIELLHYIEELEAEKELLKKKVDKYILRWGIIQ